MMEETVYRSYDDYPSVLEAKHIQKILDIGERQTYELLNSKQFHVVKVGRMFKVSKEVFIRWLEG